MHTALFRIYRWLLLFLGYNIMVRNGHICPIDSTRTAWPIQLNIFSTVIFNVEWLQLFLAISLQGNTYRWNETGSSLREIKSDRNRPLMVEIDWDLWQYNISRESDCRCHWIGRYSVNDSHCKLPTHETKQTVVFVKHFINCWNELWPMKMTLVKVIAGFILIP